MEKKDRKRPNEIETHSHASYIDINIKSNRKTRWLKKDGLGGGGGGGGGALMTEKDLTKVIIWIAGYEINEGWKMKVKQM